MPAWLISALRMLSAGGLFAAGTEIATQFGFPAIGPGLPSGGGQVIEGMILPPHPHKRRRRRRALTATDKVDIAFIAGILGKPAGKDFAMIVAARN